MAVRPPRLGGSARPGASARPAALAAWLPWFRWFRWRLRRTPPLFWLAAVAAAAVVGSTVAGIVADAEARARRFGELRSVPVVVHRVEVGDEIGAGDVRLRRLPAALVPPGRLAPDRGVGRVALVPLLPGEVLLAAKVAPDGRTGVAALLPEGRRALAVPAGPGIPPLAVGDRVDVLATYPPETAAAAGVEPTFAVATAALVLATSEDSVTVAVLPDEAPRLAFALTTGAITLALTP